MKTVKIVVGVIAVLAAVWFGKTQLEQRELITRQNEAIDLQNQGKYTAAIKVYKELLPKLAAGNRDQAKKDLAKCYKRAGDNPSLSIKKQMVYYKAALKYDPNIQLDASTLKMMKKLDEHK